MNEKSVRVDDACFMDILKTNSRWPLEGEENLLVRLSFLTLIPLSQGTRCLDVGKDDDKTTGGKDEDGLK